MTYDIMNYDQGSASGVREMGRKIFLDEAWRHARNEIRHPRLHDAARLAGPGVSVFLWTWKASAMDIQNSCFFFCFAMSEEIGTGECLEGGKTGGASSTLRLICITTI